MWHLQGVVWPGYLLGSYWLGPRVRMEGDWGGSAWWPYVLGLASWEADGSLPVASVSVDCRPGGQSGRDTGALLPGLGWPG